jgi:hypothetical protein
MDVKKITEAVELWKIGARVDIHYEMTKVCNASIASLIQPRNL